MKIPQIYLETTIFSFVFADDSPEKTWATIRLFEEIQTGLYVPYASDYVIDELSKASEPLRSDLLNLIDRYGIITLEAQEEATKLAQIYLREKIVPPSRCFALGHSRDHGDGFYRELEFQTHCQTEHHPGDRCYKSS